MSAFAFDFASTDGTLNVSPTVATLDVRGALAPLRRILSADLPPSVRFEDAWAELDALEGVFVDALLRFDGMVAADNYDAEVQHAKDLEQERDDEETRREAAESRLEEYLQADEDTVEHVLASLLVEQSKHDDEIARFKEKAKIAGETAEKYKRDAADADAERSKLAARMGSWLEDRTAAETADHFRAKCEAACRERADYANAVRDGIAMLRRDAGRSKVRQQALRDVEEAIATAERRIREKASAP